MKKQSKTKNVIAVIAVILCLFLGFSLIVPLLSGASSEQVEPGEPGNGIHSVDKTATNGLTDTYTITFTDGSTYSYTLTNGEKGATGATGATGNGIQGIEKTATDGLVDTYTITFTNGSIYTYTVTNGADGESISGGTTIPAEAIIDVDELPQDLEVYSILSDGTKNRLFPDIPLPVYIYIVDALPKEVDDFWLNLMMPTKVQLYYLKSEKAFYGANGKMTNSVITEWWWSPFDELKNQFAFSMEIIHSDEEAIEDNTLYLVVKVNEINENVFYRVSNSGFNIYMVEDGEVINLNNYAAIQGMSLKFKEVDTIDNVSNPIESTELSMYCYVDNTGMVYCYMEYNWVDICTFMDIPEEAYYGIIDTVPDATTAADGMYLYKNVEAPKLYHYKDGWNEVGSGTKSETTLVENGWKLIRNYNDLQPIILSGQYSELMIAYQGDILDSNCPVFSSPIPKETLFRAEINIPIVPIQISDNSFIFFRVGISDAGKFAGFYQFGETIGELTADNYIDNAEWGCWTWELWYKYDVSSSSGYSGSPSSTRVELTYADTDVGNYTISFVENGSTLLNKLYPILQDIKTIRGSSNYATTGQIANANFTFMLLAMDNNISVDLGFITETGTLYGRLLISDTDVKLQCNSEAAILGFGVLLSEGGLIFET